jgi:hypothetical protein
MCCFLLALVIFGPRLAFLIYWLTPGGNAAVNGAYDTFIIPFIGWLFLPWTTLMYAVTWSVGRGVSGFDWVIIAIALFADIASYGLGAGRKRISYYEGY